ncbi:hypothetical protein STEG23_001377, partial [Scotinomys teguina]
MSPSKRQQLKCIPYLFMFGPYLLPFGKPESEKDIGYLEQVLQKVVSNHVGPDDPTMVLWCKSTHLCSSICPHVFCGLPVTPTSPLHGGLASLSPCCLALDSSSSSPCPAFLSIAKSVPFICRLTHTQLPKLLPSSQHK